jgi:peptidoglycan/xylan/chitin deacetylase (PgdA/CDA1 family)
MKHFANSVRLWARWSLQFVAIELLGRGLYYCGVLFAIGLLRQRFGRRRLFIPMYHRVTDRADADDAELLAVQRGVPVDLLEKHLRIFRWFGPLQTLGDAFDHMHHSADPCRSVIAITFDDGYRDNITLAAPVFERHGARATIFPVVRTAGGGRPLWWDELTRALARGNINGGGLVPYLSNLNHCNLTSADRERVGPRASRAAMAEFLCERLVELPGTARDQVLVALAERLNVGRAECDQSDLYANWDELRAVADAGFEIGGHTFDHVVLPHEDPVDAEIQIAGSRKAIEQVLRRPVRSFAYPNGRHDATVRALTAAAGFRLAITVEHGVNYADTDPFAMRRMPIGRERPFELALKLAFYGWANRGR